MTMGSASCTLDLVEQYPDGMQLQQVADKLGVDITRIERAQQAGLEKARNDPDCPLLLGEEMDVD